MVDVAAARPSVAQLFSQLGSEAADFAAAEMAVVRAEVSSRTGIAKPGVILLVIGLALVFGTVLVLPVGLLIILTPFIGGWMALLAIGAAGSIAAFLCLKLGIRRLKTALKRPDKI